MSSICLNTGIKLDKVLPVLVSYSQSDCRMVFHTNNLWLLSFTHHHLMKTSNLSALIKHVS